MMEFFSAFSRKLSRLSWLNLAFFVLSGFMTGFLTFVIPQPFMGDLLTRVMVFAVGTILGAIFLQAWQQGRSDPVSRGWVISLACSGLFAVSIHLALSYIPDVSDIPFTLTWSEASRYYYASLFFSDAIYGVHVPPTVLHPSRYLLQAVPFLIQNSPLWLHRLWQVLLWIFITLGASWTLARRLKIGDPLIHWLVVGFLFNYLLIGPVYYHLLVPVILVAWGFRLTGKTKDTILSIAVVLLASIWCGISRINWFPVPGFLAATFILLEQPISSHRVESQGKSWRPVLLYVLKLAGWVIFGSMVAFGSQLAYIRWSGNAADQFATSFSSGLLWHRLLPNLTYPPGILLGITLVSLPFVVIILNRLFVRQDGCYNWQRIHPTRLVGLAGALALFLAGGVIVSVKIGGGSNLHNLDAFMVFLVVQAGYFYFNRVQLDIPVSTPETAIEIGGRPDRFSWLSSLLTMRIAVATAILLAVGVTITTRDPAPTLPDPDTITENLHLIGKAVKQAREDGGDILFISNRQLLTFHYIDTPLIPDYERVFLMETAMANDPAYMARFHEDLRQQKFDLIISEPLSREIQEPKDDFGAENNAWVKQVSTYVLCYYKSTKTLKDVRVQLLAPSPEPKTHCP